MYMGKDSTEVRNLQRTLMPDIVGLDTHKPTSLREIANKAKADKQHRFQNLYRSLDKSLLLHCWDELNKSAASGVDRVTAQAYAQELHANLQRLEEKLKSKHYKAKLVRRCYIPKENGKERPLGIPALEDKLVQSACAKLLMSIYEQDFVAGSYGYRPGRGAKDAVRDLTFDLQYGCYGYVVEADIKGFFDHLCHDKLLEMLKQRIDDGAFLQLIEKWLKAGILEPDGEVVEPESGVPQGGSISPILANVYLHNALDMWFEEVVQSHCHGALLCRYADDWVCAFRFREDAEKFYRVLPKRLAKYNLEVAPEKTNLLRFSRFHPSMKRRFTFLGFEFFWKQDRQGLPRVKRRTSRKKLQMACKRIKEWIKTNRHLGREAFFKSLNMRLKGHYSYYGVRGNAESLYRFYKSATSCVFKWLNRRGGKRRSYDGPAFNRLLEYVGIARPKIMEDRRRRVFA